MIRSDEDDEHDLDEPNDDLSEDEAGDGDDSEEELPTADDDDLGLGDIPPPSLEDEDLDLDDGDDDEDDDEGDGDGEGEEDGEPVAAAAKKKAKKSKSKASSKIEAEDDEIAHPDTKVPKKDKMLDALKWAFENEEDIPEGLLEKYAEHALLTLEANRTINLTGVLDPKEMSAKEYLDSWRITRLVPLMARKVLDLGSGAGFPGIPLALAEPNLSMTLVDGVKTKVDFMQRCIEALGLRNCRAVWDRAEDYLTTERVDVVVVRNVSSVRENVRTLRKVRHSLQDYVMLKGNSWSREVRAAEREAERLGFKLDTVWEHELPDEMGQRAILVYRAPGGHGL